MNGNYTKEISNSDLALEDLPSDTASMSTIIAFASTFNGYQETGSFEQCAKIANERRHNTLTELRACLFFEQRRARHTGSDPDEADEIYLRGLIDQIRLKVLAGDRS